MKACPALVALACLLLAAGARGQSLERSLTDLNSILPQTAAGFDEAALPEITRLAAEVEYAAADDAFVPIGQKPSDVLATARRLVKAKQQIDTKLEQLLLMRTQFAGLKPQAEQRSRVRAYLRVTGKIIDLAGRLRYLLVDALTECATELATHPAERRQLVDDLIAARSSSGAAVMSALLFDPPRDVLRSSWPDAALRSKVLRLIEAVSQDDSLEPLARFIRNPAADPTLVIQAAEVIRHIGLPQDPRPGQDSKLPAPAITADELHTALAKVRVPLARADLGQRRAALLDWLAERRKAGILDATYRIAGSDVKPGDWLLMRNPSPYNLFTDLSPGLFTHVGVVALERGADGKARMVIVDMPERGRMPATNLDAFVKRTRHYVFVRYRDEAVAAKMGQVAATLIGNETEFDLTFRTHRVFALQGKPLAGAKIHTYCAGLLLLCALQNGVDRNALFPVPEYPAGGRTLENLAKLGMSIGEDFISPTGALFSSDLKIIARREPMYEPSREIEEAIYDHFASGVRTGTLVPAPDLYQSLRLKVAQAAKQNTLLEQALAVAAGLHPDMDLLAAAKAAAVIETLDEVAYGASREFTKALNALRSGPVEELSGSRTTPQELTEIRRLQQQHAKLFRLWNEDDLSPRELRIMLVKYYIQRGRKQLDDRFFTSRLSAAQQ